MASRSEEPPVVFATAAYTGLQRAVCDLGGFVFGHVERLFFPDGERYLRLCAPTAGRDVVVLGGTISDADTLELYDLACGVVQEGAARLTIVIPFFGYSTMERAVQQGEIVTAKTRARLLSAVPAAGLGNRILLLDLHVEGIAHYFEGEARPVHIYARDVILDAIRRLGGDDFVLACTDAGRAKWVQSLANALGVPPSFVFKRRVSGSSTEVTAVSAQVEGRTVVIYDDMIRTGGSLISAARAYQEAGARAISAVVTHGVFPGDALDRLQKSGLFFAIACTDSHPRAVERRGTFLQVESIAGLLAAEIRRG